MENENSPATNQPYFSPVPSVEGGIPQEPAQTGLLSSPPAPPCDMKKIELNAAAKKSLLCNLKAENKAFEILQNRRTFTGRYLSDRLLKRLIHVGEIYHIGAGYPVLLKGRRNSAIYILLRGAVSIFLDEQGQRHLFDLGRQGDIFGEISFLYGTPCSATVIAKSHITVLAVEHLFLPQLGKSIFFQWLCRVFAEKL